MHRIRLRGPVKLLLSLHEHGKEAIEPRKVLHVLEGENPEFHHGSDKLFHDKFPQRTEFWRDGEDLLNGVERGEADFEGLDEAPGACVLEGGDVIFVAERPSLDEGAEEWTESGGGQPGRIVWRWSLRLWKPAVAEPVQEELPCLVVVFGEVQYAFFAFLEVAVDDLLEIRCGLGEDLQADGMSVGVS